MSFLELFTTSVIAKWIVLGGICYGLLRLYLTYIRVIHDEAEPPLVKQPFPIIGHLLGMLRDGSNYYTQVRWELLHQCWH